MAEPKRPVAWSSTALADLTDIWTRYAEIAGRLTADKTLRDAGAAARSLEGRPYAGRARGEVRAGLRALVSGPVVLFYRLDRTDSVEIVRVLDKRRDVEDVPLAEPERR
jgi:plasmid stabilization system protein ParE